MNNDQENKIHHFAFSKLSYKWLFAILFLLIYSNIYAANTEDSLNNAKSFIVSGKYKKAEKLLSALHTSHPDDLNILWLYAQSAYWAKHYKIFNAAYTEAMKKFPDNYYLKLDYGLKLVENGDIEKALPLLEIYKRYDSGNTDLKLAFAKIQYWQGNYDEALQTLSYIPLDNEKSSEALQLKYEILTAKSPWAKLNCTYLSDDQPLQAISPKLEVGRFFNSNFSPYVSIATPAFMLPTASKFANSISIGNKFNFFKSGVAVNVNGGFIQMPDKTNSWTGNVELSKTTFKYLQLQAQATYQPYLITLSSIDTAVVPYQYSVGVGWNNQNAWNGKVIGNINQFSSDKNYVYAIGGWVFAPPLKFSAFKLRLGYAYGYSSSKENRFAAKSSLQEILANYDPENTSIKGIYNPYFTPTNQSVHSGIFNISYNPRKKLAIGANANLCFIGTTHNPYLFLDKNTQGETYIDRGYSTVNFYPKEISAFVFFQLTNKLSVKADYTFLQNNFYTSHTAGLTLKASFWNEK